MASRRNRAGRKSNLVKVEIFELLELHFPRKEFNFNFHRQKRKKFQPGSVTSGQTTKTATTMVRILDSGPSCPGFDSQGSQKFSVEKIVNIGEVNQIRCLKEIG